MPPFSQLTLHLSQNIGSLTRDTYSIESNERREFFTRSIGKLIRSRSLAPSNGAKSVAINRVLPMRLPINYLLLRYNVTRHYVSPSKERFLSREISESLCLGTRGTWSTKETEGSILWFCVGEKATDQLYTITPTHTVS